MIKKILNEPLYKNSVYLIVNQALMALFGFVFWSFATKTFASNDIGLATAVISAVSIISNLSLLGLNVAILKYKDRVLNFNALLVTSLISLIVSVVFLLSYDKLNFDGTFYFVSFVLFALFQTAYVITSSVLISQDRQKIVLIKDLAFSILKVSFVFVLSGLIGLLWSWFIGILVALLVSLIFVKLEFKISLHSLKKISSFSFFNYLSSLLGALPGLLLPIIIVHYLDASYSAYFYVAWMIAGLLFIIPGSISSNLLAVGDLGKLRKALLFSLILLLFGVVGVFVCGSFVLGLFNPEYIIALNLLYILALSSIPYGVRTVYNSYFNVLGAYKKVMWLNLLVLVITVVGSIMFTSLIGVGLSWFVANIIGMVWVLVWK